MGRLILLVMVVIVVAFSTKSCDHALDVKRSLWDNQQQ